MRRRCPFCQLSFKTRPYPSDGVSMHRLLSQKLVHQNAHEAQGGLTRRACLYCGKTAPPDGWLTPEQRAFLEEVAAAFLRQVQFEQLAYVQRTLGQNPRPTFVQLAPAPTRARAMPPEPDDLVPVPLLCCGEEAKALPQWRGSVYCPRCGAKQTRLQIPSPPGRGIG
ncbi:MAG: hypothetical protein ACOZIN_03255 [Myxococcota bacterium]